MNIKNAQVIIVSLSLLFALATRASADVIKIAVAATDKTKDANLTCNMSCVQHSHWKRLIQMGFRN